MISPSKKLQNLLTVNFNIILHIMHLFPVKITVDVSVYLAFLLLVVSPRVCYMFSPYKSR
jgi:hypothetical protein